jgi:hypothetical protein
VRSSERPALVLCGDYNGEDFDGVIEYLRNGRLSSGHHEWVTGSLFRWGGVSSRASAAQLLSAFERGHHHSTAELDEVLGASLASLGVSEGVVSPGTCQSAAAA